MVQVTWIGSFASAEQPDRARTQIRPIDPNTDVSLPEKRIGILGLARDRIVLLVEEGVQGESKYTWVLRRRRDEAYHGYGVSSDKHGRPVGYDVKLELHGDRFTARKIVNEGEDVCEYNGTRNGMDWTATYICESGGPYHWTANGW